MRFDKLELDPTPDDDGRSIKVRDEKDQNYWRNAAIEQRRTGAYETALRFYSRALEIDKTMVLAWVGQVQMLVQLAEYPQATLWSRKALEMFPNQPELLAAQAQAEGRQGNLKVALALSDGALHQRGESAYRWQVRGELMLSGREQTDRHCFDRAQLADPDWLVPLESALIYWHFNSYSLAQSRAQQAVEKAPQAPYPWFVLGQCQRKLGFDVAAVRSFARCVELKPSYTEASVQLSELRRSTLPFGRFVKRLWGG
jgi:tetratricopeptide (TPR) repeat protein